MTQWVFVSWLKRLFYNKWFGGNPYLSNWWLGSCFLPLHMLEARNWKISTEESTFGLLLFYQLFASNHEAEDEEICHVDECAHLHRLGWLWTKTGKIACTPFRKLVLATGNAISCMDEWIEFPRKHTSCFLPIAFRLVCLPPTLLSIYLPCFVIQVGIGILLKSLGTRGNEKKPEEWSCDFRVDSSSIHMLNGSDEMPAQNAIRPHFGLQ